MATDEALLQRFYDGENDAFLELVSRYNGKVDWLLRACIADQMIVVECWKSWLKILRSSGRHPETRFDIKRGPVRGYLYSAAGHLAYRWLVELKDPRDAS